MEARESIGGNAVSSREAAAAFLLSLGEALSVATLLCCGKRMETLNLSQKYQGKKEDTLRRE